MNKEDKTQIRMSKMDNRLILLGTKGGPKIGPDTAWPTSNILVVEGHPYLIDAGVGVTRQTWKAGFNPADIERIFITHHHADHNMELGGFVHNAWISGVVEDVAIYGPSGLNNLMEHYFAGQAFDIASRVGEVGVPPLADLVRWQEFADGTVYEDERVRVSALRVEHPPVHHCYSLRFECAAGVVVFGADTTYFPPLGDFAAGAHVAVVSVAGAAIVALLLMFCREVGFRHLTCLPVAHGCAAPRQAVCPAEVRITSWQLARFACGVSW